VHNELPHEVTFREQELGAIRAIAARAATIVQLHEYTADAVADAYALPPEKLVTLRHSSYQGIYPNEVSQDSARRLLGVDGRSGVVGYVGQIRPYKGILELLDAMAALGKDNPSIELLLAGKTRAEDLPAIERRLPRGMRIVRQHNFVPDDELQHWLMAADVLVFPYQKVLNSGSVLLAATFGRPCILPADSPLSAVYHGEPWVVFYGDGDSHPTLKDAIALTLRLPRDVRQSALDFAARYTPFSMAREYVSLLDQTVEQSKKVAAQPLPFDTDHSPSEGISA
jgi:glycosyltransferase involved in cell wall biosynthesis